MDRLKDKVAIVTGAASGLGKAQALLLAREGAKIVGADINEVEGIRVVGEIRSEGGRAIFIKHDVTCEKDWIELMDKTLADFGRLDVLVNNAGIFIAKSIEDTTLEDWRRVNSVNMEGVFLGTKYAIGAMKKSGGGSIINMSSIAGLVATPIGSSYIASKGGVRLFTKAAALECSKAGHNYNIRVNSIHPGIIETQMSKTVLGDNTLKEILENRNPIGRIGEPIDIANAVLYLASDESKFVTGAELIIDGGWTAQ